LSTLKPYRFFYTFFFTSLFALLIASSACTRLGFRILPPPEKKPAQGIYHTVRKGETLWRICKAYGVSVQDVAELNNIHDPSKIKVGDRIFIPGATQIKKLPPLSETIPEKKEPEPRIVRQPGLFVWPLTGGKVIQSYGIIDNQKHDGITIQAPARATVYAAADGKIAFADFLKGYGNTIIINHADDFATVYAHAGRILVRQGQAVKKGEKIAELAEGEAGKMPQLLFQVRKHNEPRNPLFYLPQ